MASKPKSPKKGEVFEVFELFVKNYKSYRKLIENSNNKYLAELFETLNRCGSENEKMQYLHNEVSSMTPEKLHEHAEKKALEEKLFTYKDFVSKVINLEYNKLKDKSKEKKKFLDNLKRDENGGYEQILQLEVSKFKRKKSKNKIGNKHAKILSAWDKNVAKGKAKENLICPYCNAEYMFLGNGYSEVDHIYPRNIYPALIYSPINWLRACKSCNIKKSNAVIDFNFEEIEKLHKNIFTKELFTFKNIDIQNNEDQLEFLATSITNNAANNAKETAQKLNEIIAYFDISFECKEINRLKIIEKHASVYKILVFIYNKFENNKKELEEIANSFVQKSGIDDSKKESEFINYMIKNEVVKTILDDWETEDRENVEVLYHWRKAYIKKLLLTIIPK